MPRRFTTEDLAQGLPLNGPSRILLVRSARADTRMEAILRRRGARVRRWNAYTLLRAPAPTRWESRLKRSGVNAVFVGSSSQAMAFAESLGRPGLSRLLRSGVKLVSIGPETSKTLAALHIPYRQAREFTFNGMVDDLLRRWKP